MDLASGVLVSMHKLTNIHAKCVSVPQDGKIFLAYKNELKIYDPSTMTWDSWRISDPASRCHLDILSVAGNGKRVLVTYDGRISTFDFQRKFQFLIAVPFVKRICICKNTLVTVTRGIRLVNLETKVHKDLCPCPMTHIKDPTDVTTFGEEHFLVSDMNLFKVYGLTGQFIHPLAVDKLIHKTPKFDCQRCVSISTFPKQGTPTHLAVACCSTLMVYSLT